MPETRCVSSRKFKFMCRNLTPKVIGLGGGTFVRCLGHEGGATMNGISVLIKETPETPSPLPPRADIIRTLPSMSWEAGPH